MFWSSLKWKFTKVLVHSPLASGFVLPQFFTATQFCTIGHRTARGRFPSLVLTHPCKSEIWLGTFLLCLETNWLLLFCDYQGCVFLGFLNIGSKKMLGVSSKRNNLVEICMVLLRLHLLDNYQTRNIFLRLIPGEWVVEACLLFMIMIYHMEFTHSAWTLCQKLWKVC